MRLRITVIRNGLPDTRVIWAVDTSSAPTIYQLLEQVNEIIPIESNGEWGLEDYVVELKSGVGSSSNSYECLHFQPVTSVLKEDDEITIRCLLTNEIKKRKFSGRTQITSDGIRLFDGVPWGRQLLQKIDQRPAVKIRPRKPKQITYTEDEYYWEGGEDEKKNCEGSNASKRFSHCKNFDQQLCLYDSETDYDDESDGDFEPETANEESTDLESLEEEEEEEEEDEEEKQVNDSGESHPDFNKNGTIISRKNFNQQLCLFDEKNDDDSENDMDFDPERVESGETDSEILDENDSMANYHETFVDKHSPDLNKDVSNVEIIDAEAEAKEIHSRLDDITYPKHLLSIHTLHSAFPTSTLDVCKYVLEGTCGDIGEAWEALSLGFPAKFSRSAITKLFLKKQDPLPSPPPSKSKSDDSVSNDSGDSSNFGGSGALVDHYDHHGLPPGSIDSGKALSFMAEASQSHSLLSDSINLNGSLDKEHVPSTTKTLNQPQNLSPKAPLNSEILEAGLSLTTSENNEHSIEHGDILLRKNSSRHTKNSDRLPSSTPSDVKNQQIETRNISSPASEEDSSSVSSSDDEEPERVSSRLKIKHKSPAKSLPLKNPLTRKTVPPGKGKKSTQNRNRRRRQSNARFRYQREGTLPAGSSIENITISGEKQDTPLESAPREVCSRQNSINAEDKSPTKTSENEEFQRRRKQLLEMLATGGVEVSTTPFVYEPSSTSMTIVNSGDDSNTISPLNDNNFSVRTNSSEIDATKAPTMSNTLSLGSFSSPKGPLALSGESDLTNNVSSRRTKLDMVAGRRMLLSALGLKSQKLTEHQKLRSEPLTNKNTPNSEKDIGYEGILSQPMEEDESAWRKKIIYRAVECVQEGIELSEPPFPFFQRWDSQQRSCKRKRSKYYQSELCDENNRNSKKSKQRGATVSLIEDQNLEKISELKDVRDATRDSDPNNNTHFSVFSPKLISNGIRENMCGITENNNNSINDLVPLPDDLSSLEDLKEDEIRPKLMIAYKELEVSAATRWQPQVSAYKTAIISSVENGEIQVILARRDIPVPEKKFDQEGNRIYVGFDEIDGVDDEEEDDGTRILSFNGLIEPKIVSRPDTVNNHPTETTVT